MNGDDLVAIVRERIKDEVAPYLWSDDAIMRYLARAERLMCKETHVLLDTALAFNTAIGASPTYVLPDRVLRVYAVRIAAENVQLGRQRGRATALQYSDTVDEPRAFSTEAGPKLVTLWPTPDAVYGMEAMCAVMPELPVAANVGSSIPDEHQEELANYAAYRCLSTNDVDGENTGTATEFRDLWGEYLRDLKREIYRYRTGDRIVLQNWTGGRNRQPVRVAPT